MNHIEAAEQAVTRKYGAAYTEIAACAARAARTATVEELDALYRARLDTHAAALRAALKMLGSQHRHDRAAAEDSLQALLEELEGPR